MSPTRTSVIGAILVAMGSVSMALYTPAMPALVENFHTDAGTIKLTLSIYFAGFAFAQLISGPVSDGWGRRRTALWFFTFYLAGSVVCTIAPTVEWLLAGRLLQGIGAAAGVALSRAIVRDQFTGQASANIMNTIGMILSVGPALAPTIGGIMLTAFGWHSIFLLMVGYGVFTVGLVLFVLPETLAQRDPANMRPVQVIRNYVTLLADRRFMRPSLIIGLTLGGLYTMAAILPFILVDRVGLSPTEFGIGMLGQSGCFLMGAAVARQVLKRHEARMLVPFGLAFILAGGGAMAFMLRLIDPSYLIVMGPVGCWAFGIAFLLPSMTTDALAPFPRIAGAASALMGFMQIGGGFVGTLVAALFTEPLTALATVLPIMGLSATLLHITLGGRGERQDRTSSVAPAE